MKGAAYALGKNPAALVVLASYAEKLAIKNARAVRDILTSTRYQTIFPGTRLRFDKASEKEMQTTAGGGVLAVGVGGGLTGRGADYLFADDLVKDMEEAKSQSRLEDIFQWFVSVARTRLMPGGKIFIVMTRWSEMDVVGRIVKLVQSGQFGEDWYRLRLPALAEKNDPLGRAEGDALWPSWYPRESLLPIQQLAPKIFEALYQQNPTSSEEKLFNRSDVVITDSFDVAGFDVVRSWDLAITDKETSDYLAGALVYAKQRSLSDVELQVYQDARVTLPLLVYCADMVHQVGVWPVQRKKIIETALQDGRHVPVLVESSRLDLAAVQQIRYDLQALGFEVVVIKPRGDKVSRKSAFSEIVSRRDFSIRAGLWNEKFLVELDAFPVTAHDDMVDAIEQAINHFLSPNFSMGFA